jgi:hypothetical protein
MGLVPPQWWKYLLGGLAGALFGALLFASAWNESIWGTLEGTGLPRLLKLPGAPIVAWYSTLLLNLTAQLSLLIWWGRSRSLKDFDGRYHVWTRTAGVWLLFSFCAATGAHEAWSTTILHFWPQNLRNAGVLLWLVPAAGLGLNRLLVLNREMNDCRASRVLLFAAAGAYLPAGGLQLDFVFPVSARAQQFFMSGAALTGHLLLFLSMWVHARHVLYFTADPSRAPRRRLRIPRPHFSLPSLQFLWRKRPEEKTTAEPATEERPTRRRKPRKSPAKNVETANEAVAGATPVEAPVTGESTSRPRYRLDTRHTPPRVERLSEPEPEPAPTPAVDMVEEATPADDIANEASTRERWPESVEDQSILHEQPTEPPETVPSSPEPADDDWDEASAAPDLRGLSKKQRRKVLAEMREKERAIRRR